MLLVSLKPKKLGFKESFPFFVEDLFTNLFEFNFLLSLNCKIYVKKETKNSKRIKIVKVKKKIIKFEYNNDNHLKPRLVLK